MKTLLEYYEKTATSWSIDWLNDKEKSGISNFFYKIFSHVGNFTPRILDVGCGAGYDSFILSNLGAEVVGIDFCEKLIEISAKNVQKCSFYVKDIRNSFEDLGKFDGVFCNFVLNYIDIVEMKKVIDNISKVMKKGAILFISVVDGNGKNEQKSFSVIDGEEYDLNFFNINAEQLCTFSKPNLKLVDTFMFDKNYLGNKYYAFQKISN